MDSDPQRNELEELRKIVAGLERRVAELESRADEKSPGAQEVERTASAEEAPGQSSFESPQGAASPEPDAEKVAEESAPPNSAEESGDSSGVEATDAYKTADENAATSSDAEPQAKENADSKQTEEASSTDKKRGPAADSLESRIGLYWLSRAGIGFLVIGVAFLVMYSFQYFGSWMKLATGFAAAATLLGLGEWFERKGKITWYGRTLEGGGWALAYFTTFAMHHIPSVQVIADPTISFILLMAVAALSVTHAVFRRSEMIAILSVVLGFITLALSPPGAFSAASSLVLTGTMSVLAIKMNWMHLNIFGLISGYVAYMVLAGASPAEKPESFVLHSCYLVAFWLAQQLIAVLAPRHHKDKVDVRSLMSANIVNTVLFNVLWLPVLYRIYPDSGNFGLLILAAAYALSGFAAEQAQVHTIARLNSLSSLTLCTAYLPAALSRDWTVLAWAAELPIIVWAGVTYQLRSFRWFALALGLALVGYTTFELYDSQSFALAGMTMPWAPVSGSVCLLALAAAAILNRLPRFFQLQSVLERQINYNTFLTYAALTAFWLPPILVSRDYTGITPLTTGSREDMLLVVWALEAFTTCFAAIKLREWYLTAIATGWLFVLACAAVACNDATLAVPVTVLATIYAAAFMARKLTTDAFGKYIPTVWVCIASFFTWLFMPSRFHENMELAPLLWAPHALATLALGFHWKDRVVRGFAAAAALVCCFTGQLGLFEAGGVAASLYAGSYLYLRYRDENPRVYQIMQTLYSIGGTFALTVDLMKNLQSGALACALSVEGLALLGCGFWLKDKCFRLSGLAVFALLILKLLFVDLQGADTIQRILAFIVAGVILLLASFGYAWFSKKLAADQPAPENN